MLDLVLAMLYEFLGAWYYACWSWYMLVLVPWWTSVNYKNSGYHGIYINIFCCKMLLYFYCRYSYGSSSKQCQANLTYDLVSEHKRHYARCPIFVIARIFFFKLYIYCQQGLWFMACNYPSIQYLKYAWLFSFNSIAPIKHSLFDATGKWIETYLLAYGPLLYSYTRSHHIPLRHLKTVGLISYPYMCSKHW